MKWEDQIPDVERERWAVLWAYSVEAYNDFEADALTPREMVRTPNDEPARTRNTMGVARAE
ncbi:hypothetical protein [Actinospica robiniae]|uniref:hypothetical protein n=1 Tax=Actinospica robiniae TaxID=304901 RepID=UPI0003FF730C|nr:hypothetical protein [Actinospica robiniae]